MAEPKLKSPIGPSVTSYGVAGVILLEADAKFRRGSVEVRSYELLEHYSVSNLIFSGGWVETFEQADEHFKSIQEEIKTQFALPGSSPLAEAEAIHDAGIAETIIEKRLRKEA